MTFTLKAEIKFTAKDWNEAIDLEDEARIYFKNWVQEETRGRATLKIKLRKARAKR